MPRAIWSGAISFGLVNVPIKLYSATSQKTVRFHQLHAKDGVRIQQKRICPADGEEVSYEDIVKGYEIAPDRYVIIRQEELDALDPRHTKTIDIESFVELADIDPSTTTALPRRSGHRRGEALRAAAVGDGAGRQGRDRPLRAAHAASSCARCGRATAC